MALSVKSFRDVQLCINREDVPDWTTIRRNTFHLLLGSSLAPCLPALLNLFRRKFHFVGLGDASLVLLLFSVEGLAVAIEDRRFNNIDDDDLDLSVWQLNSLR